MTIEQKQQILELKNQGLSYGKISTELGVSVNTVSSFIKRLNKKLVQSELTVENKYESPILDSKCKQCGKQIIQGKMKKRKFCCNECRTKWWTEHAVSIHRRKEAIYSFICPTCKKAFVVYGNANRKYCCHDCYVKGRYKDGFEAIFCYNHV